MNKRMSQMRQKLRRAVELLHNVRIGALKKHRTSVRESKTQLCAHRIYRDDERFCEDRGAPTTYAVQKQSDQNDTQEIAHLQSLFLYPKGVIQCG